MSETSLDDLVTPDQYRAQRSCFFPSEGSLQWYLRCRRADLVECGAIVLHAGRWYVVPARFGAYVLKAGAEAARRQLQPALHQGHFQ